MPTGTRPLGGSLALPSGHENQYHVPASGLACQARSVVAMGRWMKSETMPSPSWRVGRGLGPAASRAPGA